MDEYAGRVLADRYRLPLLPGDEFEPAEIRAFDTYSGQEVLVRQVPLPEVVDAEMLDESGAGTGFGGGPAGGLHGGSDGRSDGGPGAGVSQARRASARTTRRPAEPAVRRAMEAAQSAAQIPDHPRLDQVFDVFAEGGSLWVVSELVEATPLAAMLAERPLNPYRAAEIASDVLTALRVLHAHGWTHRNITARTVLVCDDGRVVLTGLAAGAAEEALCGYDPVPAAELSQPGVEAGGDLGFDSPAAPEVDGAEEPYGAGGAYEAEEPYGAGDSHGAGGAYAYGTEGPYGVDAPGAVDGPAGGELGRVSGDLRPGAEQALPAGPALPPGYTQDERRGQPGGQMYDQLQDAPGAAGPEPGLPAASGGGGVSAGDVRAARAGAIAAYRAGARAAARVSGNEQGTDAGAFPVQRPASGSSQPGRQEPAGFRHGAQPRSGAGEGMRADDLRGAHDREAQEREAQERAARSRSAQDREADGLPGAPEHGAPEHGVHEHGAHGQSAHGQSTNQHSAHDRAAHQQPHDRTAHAPGTPGPRAAVAVPDGWDQDSAGSAAPARRGPGTALAAERARQARITVVGAVTERWAPEQAGPVHGNWQLAAPVGPATDLWALGALLFRAVQGHAPYPEESAAELVQLVCAEPPAFAEECGPLRPVVESLLRQDPTERPDIEELRGWLRSLVRSAPEPDAGQGIVPVPPVDATRLPIVRRRGELVRRRRRTSGGDGVHGRHRQQRKGGRRREQGPAGSARPVQSAQSVQPVHSVAAGPPDWSEPAGRRPGPDAKPRSLGRTLLVVILVVLVAALVYALKFMPKADDSGHGNTGAPASVPTASASGQPNSPVSGGSGQSQQPGSAGTPQSPQGTEPDSGGPAAGYAIRKDPEGFQVAVAKDWERRPVNDADQVRFLGGDFELVVVPGRDSVKDEGADPMAYQRDKERELKPFRDSTWSSASGLRRIDVGKQAMAEGQFTWQDGSGREVYVRNVAMIIAGRYHIVQVIGPEAQRDKVTEIYEQAVATYRTVT
ncbi:protein kinase [Streptomyces sp. NBC_01411]|uniref:protein kinase n=1 Tax=Streptomyces sp. NBC_01411 TaxID=2903857 RepID=UPI003244BD3F